ncbi:hypothetical protein SAMN05877838_1526 [Hoeflea halophila]|uniref:Uncharacterized protein n=1 Tax=Hoeflea halophila TaxID=714899 RepID=A0A286I9I7_9HYPH|nr:hypothetical protein [Hoeflea halophila]SOE16647.1 hypothetical protein SAMN05877838_1526 [Hoeflea halophila]
MGVSHRAAHAIEPGTADLLMPERTRQPRIKRVRDVEDASFEAISAPRDLFLTRSNTARSGNVFKSRLVQPEADGPVPRDFAVRTMSQGERLDVFSHAKATVRVGRTISQGMLLAFLISAMAAGIAFWLAGGHALIAEAGNLKQGHRISTTAQVVGTPAAVLPDPVVTSAVPLETPPASAGGYTAALPRPARIERAGSILMIRPAGN